MPPTQTKGRGCWTTTNCKNNWKLQHQLQPLWWGGGLGREHSGNWQGDGNHERDAEKKWMKGTINGMKCVEPLIFYSSSWAHTRISSSVCKGYRRSPLFPVLHTVICPSHLLSRMPGPNHTSAYSPVEFESSATFKDPLSFPRKPKKNHSMLTLDDKLHK